MDERKEQAMRDAAQSLINAADRPRLRALEEDRRAHPGYWARQPDQEPGHWRVDGTLGVPDGSRSRLMTDDEYWEMRSGGKPVR